MKKINWQYTLGEILIVIIGISIAFSMNRCAENAKNESEKKQYLSNLKNDILDDKLQLEENLKAIDEKIKTASEVIPIVNSDAQNKASFIGKIFSIANITNFTPKDNTYQTLINSGDFKLIDDFDTKKAIEEHYSNYEVMMKDYDRQENIHKEYLGPYFINNADYDAMRKGQFGFTDEKLLKNILQSMNVSFGFKQKATQKGIESCDKLLAILNKKTPL